MTKVFKIMFLAAAVLGLSACCQQDLSDAEKAARGVLKRTLGYDPCNVIIEVTGPENDSTEYYSTEVRCGKLTVKASSTIAACRGFYDYVKANHYGMVTWTVNNIDLPFWLPKQELRKVTTPFVHRQYMNVCTMGYTAPYWKFETWEKELDWMALHGIDMPLAPIGSEAIFARVWKKLGLTDEEIGDFVVGPAHFPWFRMGNMTKLGGHLSQAYYDQTIDLAHQLIDRMNELGMSPIYNAFAGFVPDGIKRVFPDTELIHAGWDNGEYYVSNFISPETDLFQTIATEYIKEWEAEFGKGEFYLADSFNEMKVPFAKKGTQERFDQIASYGKHLYNSISSANPDATWVLQGWMFGYQRHIWDPESIKALFSEVPDERLLLLDLSVDFNYDIWESEYTWNYAQGIFGKKWIYSTTPNFGGRTCPVGNIEFYLNGHLNALNSPNKGNLIGLGSAPEGVENNEVLYEAIYDAAWNFEKRDVMKWLEDYSLARYGEYPEALRTYWTKMLQSSYGMCSSRAEYRIQQQPIYLLGGRYDVTPAHFEGLEAFIAAADELSGNKDYITDLALNAGFYAFGKAELLASEIHRAYLCGDKERAAQLEVRFEDLMVRADRFFESNPVTRLERWIDFARAWGVDEAESDKYEMDARRLVTVWGPGHCHDGLNDYSCRMWSGLIRDYYLPRWKHFFEAKKQGVPFDFDQWEYKFCEEQTGVSEVEPYEDLVAAARQLVADAGDIATSQDELPGWTPFEMTDDKTRVIHMIRPEDYKTLKALRFTWRGGEDDVLLKKVQINGAGWVRIKKDNIDAVIGKNNPVVEIPLDIKGDDSWKFTYLHIYLEQTKKRCDSNVTIEYVRQ